jgi:phosphate starvation-inducible protein PhoH
MTRIGSNSKYIFLGDIEQIDMKKKGDSCLAEVLNIFRDEEYVGTVEFTDDDCVRNPLIPLILAKLRERGI